MAKLLRSFALLTVLIVVGAGAYWYFSELKPCVRPITYRIGNFDTEFGISREDFIVSIAEAESIWEEAIGKELFTFTSDGKVAVNLIFDERQEETQEQRVLQEKIDRLQEQYSAKKSLLDEKSALYTAATNQYESLAGDFNERTSQYESDVRYWNRRGGAPENTYQELTAEKKELEVLQQDLEVRRSLVNTLADEVNVLIGEANALAKEINVTVDDYNQSNLIGTQFDQGIYTRDRGKVSVNIYQFSDREKLIRVLAHEFGHVLGLDHNGNPESIMYELNIGDNERLSTEDLSSLKETCSIEL